MDWQKTITNLLNKAEDPATTPAESEALTERAAYLMAKFGITELLKRDTTAAPLQATSITLTVKNPYAVQRRTLIHRLSRALGCRSVRSGDKVFVFGLQRDLDNFSLLFVSLWVQANLSMLASTRPEGVHGKTHNHSYLVGFVDEVSVRVQAATRKAHTEESNTVSTALVLANRTDAVSAAVAAVFPHLTSARNTTKVTSDASYSSGKTDGRRADINQPRMGSVATSRRALE
jgi:hypothetical protein